MIDTYGVLIIRFMSISDTAPFYVTIIEGLLPVGMNVSFEITKKLVSTDVICVECLGFFSGV